MSTFCLFSSSLNVALFYPQSQYLNTIIKVKSFLRMEHDSSTPIHLFDHLTLEHDKHLPEENLKTFLCFQDEHQDVKYTPESEECNSGCYQWVWSDDHPSFERDYPAESLMEEEKLPPELDFRQLHRVKSSRMEQQSKIADFLDSNKLQFYMSSSTSLQQEEAPAKQKSTSLSPRKIRRATKSKPLRLK